VIKALYLQQQPIEASPRACSWRPIGSLPLADELQATKQYRRVSSGSAQIHDVYTPKPDALALRARGKVRAGPVRARGKHRKPSVDKRAYMSQEGYILPTPQICQVLLPTCWRTFFCGFGKNSNLPSAYAEHLELLI